MVSHFGGLTENPETPLEHSKYLSGSLFHEAGFDSFTTAKVLIRLSARIEEAAKGADSPPSEDEIYYPASENGKFPSVFNDLLTRRLMSNEGALDRRKQTAQQKSGVTEAASSQMPASLKTGDAQSEVQAALDRQAALFKNLGLDDEEPQFVVGTHQHPLVSTSNPYALLQGRDLDDGETETPFANNTIASDGPTVHIMMPAGDSPFWMRYGNKLRVNGTVEEVCVIE